MGFSAGYSAWNIDVSHIQAHGELAQVVADLKGRSHGCLTSN
jgi:hypothetical protein